MRSIELRPGQVVELELAKSKDETLQFRTLVEEYKGDTEFTLLAPMYKSTPYPFREQDVVDLIYTVHDEENKPHAFVFKAKTIERYRRGELTYLRVIRISDVTKLQRRGFYRLNYVADMFYEILSEEESQETPEVYTLITRDISAGGFRGIVHEQIPAGTRLRFHLNLGKEPILINAKVISVSRVQDSSTRYEIRTEFFGLTARDTGELIQAINHMQSEYIRRMAASSLEERLAAYGHDELLYSERRRGKDWVLKWLDWSVVLTWILTFLIMVNFLLAMPEKPNIIDHYYGYPVRLDWDMTMIQRNIYLLLALFVVSSFSIVLNATRMKREEDQYRYTLVVMGILSLILLVIYILFL